MAAWTLLTDWFRSTRSGRVFLPWEQVVVAPTPDFSFDTLLARAINAEYAVEGDRDTPTAPHCRDSNASTTCAPAMSPSVSASFEAKRTNRSHSPSAGGAPAASTVSPASSPNPSLYPQHAPAVDGASPLFSVSPNQPSASAHAHDASRSQPTVHAATGPPKRRSKQEVAKQKLRSKQRRKVTRQLSKTEPNVSRPKPPVLKQRVRASSPVKTRFVLADKRMAVSAYVGLRDPKGERRTYALHEMVGEGSRFGFKCMAWDGRTTRPIIDATGRVFAVLCGRPNDPDWEQVHERAAAVMSDAQEQLVCLRAETQHRRGNFTALAKGIRYSTGMKEPGNARNTEHNDKILNAVLGAIEFIRLAGFASSCFATWAPKLFDYYVTTMSTLCAYHPHLQRIFRNSVFACSTINFGPQTASFPHTDHNNKSFGWCAISSLGPFDPKRGGHLILWDLHLVIEFPPGSTVLIPSAALRHSNTCIQKGEKRYSFTQYTAGGLFRWVEHGFRGEPSYQRSLSANEKEMEEERRKARWAKGMAMYSTIEELKALYN